MKWKVENALSRDVERQQLNKILKDIRDAVDALSAQERKITTQVSETVRFVSGTGGGSSAPASPKPFTLKLTGGVEGTVRLTGADASMTTTLSGDWTEEAPMDGYAYWRRAGEWEAVGDRIETLAWLEGPGFAALDDLNTWNIRRIDGVQDEIVVYDGDGANANPTVGLARISLTAGELIHNLRAVMSVGGEAFLPDTSISSDALAVIGISRTSATAGNVVEVQPFGRLTEGSWSWTDGAVYCGNEGVLTQALSTSEWVLRIGRAISPTTIEIDISLPILRS